MTTIIGGEGNDLLYGTKENDILVGKKGNDTIYGDFGDDLIKGGAGNDFLYGEEGNDTLRGGEGNDILFGGRGADLLMGGEGDDHIHGDGQGSDGEGEDRGDTIFGCEGNDIISGHIGDNQLFGGIGNDTLVGGINGNETLMGEEGADVFQLFTLNISYTDDNYSHAVITGGAGKDIFFFDFSKARDVQTGSAVVTDFEPGYQYGDTLRFDMPPGMWMDVDEFFDRYVLQQGDDVMIDFEAFGSRYHVEISDTTINELLNSMIIIA